MTLPYVNIHIETTAIECRRLKLTTQTNFTPDSYRILMQSSKKQFVSLPERSGKARIWQDNGTFGRTLSIDRLSLGTVHTTEVFRTSTMCFEHGCRKILKTSYKHVIQTAKSRKPAAWIFGSENYTYKQWKAIVSSTQVQWKLFQ